MPNTRDCLDLRCFYNAEAGKNGELGRLRVKRVTVQIGYEDACKLRRIQRIDRDTTMTSDAQLQPVLISWGPLFNSPAIDIIGKHQGATIDRALDGCAQSHRAVYLRKPMDFEHGSTATASVTMNGSVKRNAAAMARGAENVARWKTYLPKECVRAMMNAGWHWST